MVCLAARLCRRANAQSNLVGIRMTSRWWRAYDEALQDPKLQGLSDECFRFWFNLCCVCSKNGGNLPTVKIMSFEFRMQERKVVRLLAELREAGLIDEDKQGIRPHNWN